MKKQFFIYAATFFYSLGNNILGLSLIFRLTDRLLFSPAQMGTYMALGQVFYFIGCNLYHRFGSSFNAAKVFTASSAVVFLASLFIGHTGSRSVIYGSYWIIQIGTGFFWPPVMAWLTEGLRDRELNRIMGVYNRTWMSANMIGPLIAGSLYAWNSTVNFIFINISLSLVPLLLYMMMRYSQKTGLPESTGQTAPLIQLAPDHDINPGKNASRITEKKEALYRYRGWICGLCSALFVGVLTNIIPLHIRDGLGFTEQDAGTVLFIRCLSGIIGFAVLSRFTSWHFNRRWFIFTQLGLLLCTLLLFMTGDRLMFFHVIVVLYGFVNSACYNNSMFYSSATGSNRKKNLAVHEIFLCLGITAGTAGGGFFYEHYGFTGTCISLFISLGLGLGVFIMLNRRESSGSLI